MAKPKGPAGLLCRAQGPHHCGSSHAHSRLLLHTQGADGHFKDTAGRGGHQSLVSLVSLIKARLRGTITGLFASPPLSSSFSPRSQSTGLWQERRGASCGITYTALSELLGTQSCSANTHRSRSGRERRRQPGPDRLLPRSGAVAWPASAGCLKG